MYNRDYLIDLNNFPQQLYYWNYPEHTLLDLGLSVFHNWFFLRQVLSNAATDCLPQLKTQPPFFWHFQLSPIHQFWWCISNYSSADYIHSIYFILSTLIVNSQPSFKMIFPGSWSNFFLAAQIRSPKIIPVAPRS